MIPIPEGRIGNAIIRKYFPADEWEKEFDLATWEIRRISEYTKLSFKEVLDLPYGAYLLYRKESWIASFQISEDGREFLKALWRLRQTEADEKAISEFRREE